jgi:hypothetical protein
LYADVSTGGGSLQIGPISADGTASTLTGVQLPQAQQTLQLEQVDAVSGRVTTAGTSGCRPDEGTTNLSATTSGSSDPATSAARTSQQDIAVRSEDGPYACSWYGSAGRAGGSVSFTGASLTDDSQHIGSSLSTVSAADDPSCDAPDGATAAGIGKPCGSGSVAPGGATLTADLDFATGNLVDLASSAPAEVFATRHVGNECTSGDATVGCIDAVATRSIGALTLGALPSALAQSSGCANLLAMDPVEGTVHAQGGPGVDDPTKPVWKKQGGNGEPQVSYCNGNGGYTTKSLADLPTDLTIPAMTLSSGESQLTVEISAPHPANEPASDVHLQVGSGSTTSQGSDCSDGCKARADCSDGCKARAQLASPISGTFEYKVTNDGTTLCDVIVSVDFGTLAVSTNYQKAPDAG